MNDCITGFSLFLPGLPVGQARARIDTRGARPRIFPDPASVEYREAVQLCWMAARRPRLPRGPYGIQCQVVIDPPFQFYKLSGELTAEAIRRPYPGNRPDLDNVIKLWLDALGPAKRGATATGVGAIPDDAMAVVIAARKVWSHNTTIKPGVFWTAYTMGRPPETVKGP